MMQDDDTGLQPHRSGRMPSLKNFLGMIEHSVQEKIRSLALYHTMQEKINLLNLLLLAHNDKVVIESCFIEVTTRCQLKCMNCFRTNREYTSKNKDMSEAVFRQIIDKLPYGVRVLVPQGIGEPTIHPNFVDLVSYARQSGKVDRIEINTNLMSHNSVEVFAKLFESGLSYLWISVDSFDVKRAQMLREKTDLPRLVDRVFLLAKRFPGQCGIRVTLSHQNVGDLADICQKAVDAGIDSVVLQKMGFVRSDPHYIEQFMLTSQDWEEVGKTEDRFKDRMNIARVDNSQCLWLYNALAYNVDGFIMPCCRITISDIVHYGKILVEDESLKEFFDSEDSLVYFDKIKQMDRRSFFKKRPFFCKGCDAYRTIRFRDLLLG